MIRSTADLVASKINSNNLERDRRKRKTIERSQVKRTFVRNRFNLEETYILMPGPIGMSSAAEIPADVNIEVRLINKGYPIMIETFFTHHFSHRIKLDWVDDLTELEVAEHRSIESV